jgi:hypothetical protein
VPTGASWLGRPLAASARGAQGSILCMAMMVIGASPEVRV